MSFKDGHHTEKAKQRIGIASKILWERDGHRENIIKKLKGQKRTEAQKIKYSLAQKKDYEYLKEILNTSLAYAAGIIDGEGCIGIGKRSGRESCQVRLTVANTNWDIIEWLHTTFHGYWMGEDKGYHKHNWKHKYMWVTANYHAIEIINTLMPYFIIKKKQAELAIDFFKHRFGDYPSQLLFKEKMHILNKKGPIKDEGEFFESN